MQDEAESLQAALDVLDQHRQDGNVNLRDVADAILRIVEGSKTDERVSPENRRRVRCKLIESELSRRWEEAVAAALSIHDAAGSPPENDDSQPAAKARAFQLASANPAIPAELRPPSLESYLAEWPGELGDYTSVLDLSMHEFSVRRLSGDAPELAEYSERFADLAVALRNRLVDVEESLEAESSIRMMMRDTDPLFRFRQDFEIATGPSAITESDEVEPLASNDAERELTLLNRTLQRVDFFRDLSADLRREVVKKLVLAPFAAGDFLLRQGERADRLLVLLEGTAKVMVAEHDRIHCIAQLTRRTVIGEMGLVTQTKRTASVVAVTSGWAATLSRDDYEALAGRNSLLSVSLSELIARRLGKMTVDALCGKHIDRYEIRRRLGRGGMGIVYLAIDRDEGRPVALKMLPHDRALDLLSSRRFRQEADIVRNLTHPNVVRMLREFSAFGTTFIAMEWCDGPALSDVIRRVGPLPPRIARSLVGQLAAGLLHTHAAGIAHRDLKPSNVLLTRQGDAKLADFGLARSIGMNDSELTRDGEMMGTPRYMAPEQIDGARGDQRTDFFSLGCIAYELWTGKPAYEAQLWREMLRERAQWVLPPRENLVPDMDVAMYAFLSAALRDEPRERDVNLAEIASWAAPVDWSALPEVSDLFASRSADD